MRIFLTIFLPGGMVDGPALLAGQLAGVAVQQADGQVRQAELELEDGPAGESCCYRRLFRKDPQELGI